MENSVIEYNLKLSFNELLTIGTALYYLLKDCNENEKLYHDIKQTLSATHNYKITKRAAD